MLNGNYASWRETVQDGDAVFFHTRPLSAIRSPLDIGGYLSNRGIMRCQQPGSEGLDCHWFVHVEVLYWAEQFGQRRLKCVGFTANGPTGMSDRFASERLQNYCAPILYLPLDADARRRYDPDAANAFIAGCIGAPYGWRDLGKAILPFWLWHPGRVAKFCSQFVFELYSAAGVEVQREYRWLEREQRCEPLPARGVSKSPMELIYRPRLWDWDKHQVLR